MSNIVKERSIGTMHLREITQEYGEAGLLERFEYEINNTQWDEEPRQRVDLALQIALDAHKNDERRGAHPYSTHFLRVAIRIMSRDHFNIRDQPDLIIAALLHDTVEDHFDYFTGAEKTTADPTMHKEFALQYIGYEFGADVAALVGAVTNPEYPEGIEKSQKNEIYQAHIRELLRKNTMAGIIKLSDFIDNCVGYMHKESPEKAIRLAQKYQPLIPDMWEYTILTPHLTNITKDHVLEQLTHAKQQCFELLAPKKANEH